MYGQGMIVTDSGIARGMVNFKQAALLFDEIVLLETPFTKFDPRLKDRPIEQLIGVDAELLLENGLLRKESDQTDDSFFAADPVYAKYRKEAHDGICPSLLSDAAGQEFYIRRAVNGAARAAAIRLGRVEDARFVPSVFGPSVEYTQLTSNSPIATEGAGTLATMRAVLKALPIPDELTPWKDILEFRRDTETVCAFAGLREWIQQAAGEQLSARELEAKLHGDLLRYEQQLKRHGIKATYLRLETVVTAPVACIENFLKLKWTDMMKTAFSVGRQEIELMEAEEELAGRQLHYIVRAQERFGAA
jgi:hypothetical protein